MPRNRHSQDDETMTQSLQQDELESYELDPEAEKRPYLPKAGRYGEGQPNGGKVHWIGFIASCRRASQNLAEGEGKGPGFDRDCQKDDYSRFDFRAALDEGGEVFLTDWETLSRNSGGKTLPWLRALGVCHSDSNIINPAEIVMSLPMEICVEVVAPKKGKDGIVRTGRLIQVFSS